MPVVNDALTETGSAVGLYTAVLASPTDRVICLACDMPFVTRGFSAHARGEVESIRRVRAAARRIHAAALRRLQQGGARRVSGVHPLGQAPAIFDIYPDFNTGYLDMDGGEYGDPEALFMNINTPAELEAARQRAAGEAGGWRAALQPRIQAFMDTSPLPVVSFIGKKKSGKTTVVLGVIEELRSRGYRVAALKHDTHGFEVDVPGTDSYRMRQAGAEVVGISSPDKYVWQCGTEEELPLADLVGQIAEPVDLVITEGFKKQDAPKIEVSRRARSSELVSTADELIGITSDQSFADYPVPQFALDDFAGLAGLIEERILGRSITLDSVRVVRERCEREPARRSERRLPPPVCHRQVQFSVRLLHAPRGRAVQAAR